MAPPWRRREGDDPFSTLLMMQDADGSGGVPGSPLGSESGDLWSYRTGGAAVSVLGPKSEDSMVSPLTLPIWPD